MTRVQYVGLVLVDLGVMTTAAIVAAAGWLLLT